MGRRNRPADPATIALRAARERADRREALKNPANWGVSPDLLKLAANENVELRFGHGGRVRHAARASDAFACLTLEPGQKTAADRYWQDWCAAAGVVARDTLRLEVIDGKGRSDGVSQGMIDGGRRLALVHRELGRVAARLLAALVEPLVMEGRVVPWREQVERVTGESERHAQGALVRSACENLRLCYEDLDRARAASGRTPPR